MPGDVIAGHADIEKDCAACHVKFERGKQTELCKDCHEDVAADIVAAVRAKEAEILGGLFRVNVNDARPVSDN